MAHSIDPADVAPLICHSCGAMLRRGDGSFWIVRIESIADPSPPEDGMLPAGEDETGMAELIEQMRGMSEQELLDSVHRRLTLLLCAKCHAMWIDDPTAIGRS